MTVTFSQLVNGSLDTAVATATLNSLTNTSYALGAAIDNRPTIGSIISYDVGDLVIYLNSTITSGASSPNIVVWILPAIDGTNYPSPPGGSGAAAPLSLSYTFTIPSSVTTQIIACPNIPIPPYLFKVQIQNNSGASFPASGNTCQMQRRTVGYW